MLEPGGILTGGLLFETELFWVPENKEIIIMEPCISFGVWEATINISLSLCVLVSVHECVPVHTETVGFNQVSSLVT